ncbi:MAG: alpha-D-ribose 1-methylphosphonate 5-triphosphate diphosphatase, partial [Pseudomonadota bacterium]
PRHGVFFPPDTGLQNTDAELATNGVTTAYLAQNMSWEGGARGVPAAEALVSALHDYRPHARTDMRIQIRYETHLIEGEEALRAMIAAGDIGYVVFNNHLTDGFEMAKERPERLAGWASLAGRTAAEHLAIMEAAAAREDEVQPMLARLTALFAEKGLPSGSHDDRDAATRDRFHALGAKVCEFPMTRVAAERARALGDPVLMGAPNVVRGGSMSGNVAAEELVAAGLCDGLVSDYYAPALAAAAWALLDRGVLDFAAAWRLVSSGPAAVMGLSDRGEIRVGTRADLVVVNPETRRISGVMAAGQGAHLAGDALTRLVG